MSSHDQQEADERWIRGIDEDDRAPRDDGASAEPWPEVRESDVAWLRREAAGPTMHAAEWIDSPNAELRLAAEHTYKPLAERYARILAVLEYARTHAQQARTDSNAQARGGRDG